jgi:eukaryotic-like serine/threonine-protein kinase
MHRIVEGRLTPPRELNPGLEEELVRILQEALATDRAARIPDMEALHLRLSQWTAAMAPMFPVHTLKHLTALLCEPELTARGRPPLLPPKFREQVARWISQQKVKPRPPAEAAAPWPGTTAAGSARPDTGSDATRPVRRVARAEAREAWARPEEEALDGETRELAPVVPGRPAAPAVNADAPPDGYAKAVGVLMNLPSWRLLAAGAVLAVMLFKIAVAYFGWGTPPLVIRSDPPGALVSIDHTFKGKTPLELPDISRSEPHTLELTRQGMKVWSRRFEPGTLSERLDVTLEPVNPLQRAP